MSRKGNILSQILSEAAFDRYADRKYLIPKEIKGNLIFGGSGLPTHNFLRRTGFVQTWVMGRYSTGTKVPLGMRPKLVLPSPVLPLGE